MMRFSPVEKQLIERAAIRTGETVDLSDVSRAGLLRIATILDSAHLSILDGGVEAFDLSTRIEAAAGQLPVEQKAIPKRSAQMELF